MRVLVIGGYGLIGGYVVAALVAGGHQVVGAGRDIRLAKRQFPFADWQGADLATFSAADWAPLLSRALGDEDGRRAMAKRAWDYVRNGRMFADQDPIRRGWYQSLWDRRAELEAGLMARLPGLAQAVAARRG